MLSVLCVGLTLASLDVMDYSSWNRVLSTHLSQGSIDKTGVVTNLVNYTAVKEDPDFAMFLKDLAAVDMSRVTTRDAFYALYMNAYNAFVIDMIINHPCSMFGTPIHSIRDIVGVFDKSGAGVIGGKSFSLNEVEATLRNPSTFNPAWEEIQLVHACIVCAGMSCPSLSMNAYNNTAENVTVQMERSMRTFLRNEKKGSLLDRTATTLEVSKIFSWFPGDFHPSVLQYLLPYFTEDDSAFIAKNMASINSTLSYFDYDWQLNSVTGEAPCK